MRIAVVGNSHVGMIRAASADPAFDHCTFEWMARHTPETHNFKVEGGCLIDTTGRPVRAAGLKREICFAEADAALVLGNTLKVSEVARLCRAHWITGWYNPPRAKSLLARFGRKAPIRSPITQASFRAALIGHIQENMTHNWLVALRQSVEIPFYVVPPPFAREAVLAPATGRHEAFRGIADLNIFSALAAAFNEAHQQVFQSIPRTTVLLQDDRTITGGFFTKEAYSRGATSLDPAKSLAADDMLHGNANFGNLILDRVLKDLRKAQD